MKMLKYGIVFLFVFGCGGGSNLPQYDFNERRNDITSPTVVFPVELNATGSLRLFSNRMTDWGQNDYLSIYVNDIDTDDVRQYKVSYNLKFEDENDTVFSYPQPLLHFKNNEWRLYFNTKTIGPKMTATFFQTPVTLFIKASDGKNAPTEAQTKFKLENKSPDILLEADPIEIQIPFQFVSSEMVQNIQNQNLSESKVVHSFLLKNQTDVDFFVSIDLSGALEYEAQYRMIQEEGTDLKSYSRYSKTYKRIPLELEIYEVKNDQWIKAQSVLDKTYKLPSREDSTILMILLKSRFASYQGIESDEDISKTYPDVNQRMDTLFVKGQLYVHVLPSLESRHPIYDLSCFEFNPIQFVSNFDPNSVK